MMAPLLSSSQHDHNIMTMNNNIIIFLRLKINIRGRCWQEDHVIVVFFATKKEEEEDDNDIVIIFFITIRPQHNDDD